ncbi:hypothetical protein [Streptococcus suis]|uniref:hypothetical protein n=1 Tax=Streptococcus suis TaxID=1307 RepID=UPI001EE77058|nr:hypothetical protein [Streptococcus suis]MDN2999399.1 hypothetical protein [Streptococcus suis]MDN3003288.1 hypothetical protein [Streptococcus suis]
MPLPQDLALEIANQWRYQPPLDAYTISANPEIYAVMISPEARGDRFLQSSAMLPSWAISVLTKMARQLTFVWA